MQKFKGKIKGIVGLLVSCLTLVVFMLLSLAIMKLPQWFIDPVQFFEYSFKEVQKYNFAFSNNSDLISLVMALITIAIICWLQMSKHSKHGQKTTTKLTEEDRTQIYQRQGMSFRDLTLSKEQEGSSKGRMK